MDEAQESEHLTDADSVLICRLGDTRIAIPLRVVVEVVRLPYLETPIACDDRALGYFDYHGEVLHAISLRACCGLVPRELQLSDIVVIVRTEQGCCGWVVDEALDLRALPDRDGRSAPAADRRCTVGEFVPSPEGILLRIDPLAVASETGAAVRATGCVDV